jgi:type I restriction enzyme S subunit
VNVLPETWIQVSLGEITEPIEKVLPAKDPEKEIRYLDISGIDNSSNRVTEAKTYIGADAPSRARQLVREGDVLFSTVRTYLKNIARVPSEYDGQIASTGFSVLRPSTVILSEYLFAYSLTPMLLDPLAALQRGSSYPAVREQDVRTQTIPLPPLAEQKRIVSKIEELFSELDAGEESLRRARRQLGVYRQSLLKQAFEGKLTAPWRKQNPDLLESPEVESVEVSEHLPLDWRSIKLGSAIENPSYGTSKKCSYESAGHGVLRIPNVVNGAIDAADLKFAEFTKDEVASYELKAGDLLMIRSNGSVSIVGRCALIEPKHTGFLYAGYLIRLRPIKSLIAPLFLRIQLGSLRLRSQIEFSAKSTSGVNNINSKEIQRLVIALPSLPEQREIVRLLDEQFTVIEQNEREIDAALKRCAALRQSILKKAFTGQLVPQDPTDEPASALLERIRKEREKGAVGKSTRKRATPA